MIKATCHNCEKVGHYSRDCREKRVNCMICGRTGHLGKYCLQNKGKNISLGQKMATSMMIIICLIGMLFPTANAFGTVWENPDVFGDYFNRTSYPDFKGTPTLIIHADERNYLDCPCEGQGKGFGTGDGHCYSPITVGIRISPSGLVFTLPEINALIDFGFNRKLAWAITARNIMKGNRRAERPTDEKIERSG
uniref:CCHC-type domain-containing protein n=1 Tax=Strongyloides stercoralis TaxID=6248 RepID=A0A0K0EA33_STRER